MLEKNTKSYKVHNIDQRSDEWFAIRATHFTASNALTIATGGKGLETVCYDMLTTQLTGRVDEYTNIDIQRGVELEDSARMIYEIMGHEVEEVGFCELDEWAGCSPDGLMNDKGLEIKCPNDRNYFKILIGQKPEKKYIYQCQFSMYVTGLDSWDLVFYNPNFEKQMTILTISRDEEVIEKIKQGIEKGKEIITNLREKYAKNLLR